MWIKMDLHLAFLSSRLSKNGWKWIDIYIYIYIYIYVTLMCLLEFVCPVLYHLVVEVGRRDVFRNCPRKPLPSSCSSAQEPRVFDLETRTQRGDDGLVLWFNIEKYGSDQEKQWHHGIYWEEKKENDDIWLLASGNHLHGNSSPQPPAD